MKKFIARGAGVVAAVVAAASFAMLGAGLPKRTTPPARRIPKRVTIVSNQYKATPVLATVSGDQLPLDDCIVTSWTKSSAVSALGENTGAKVLLNVNCNAKVAQAGVPGNSAMTPQGK